MENYSLSFETPGYKDGSTDLSKPDAYIAFKNGYKTTLVKGFSTYHIPYLNIFSETYSNTVKISPELPYKATLQLHVFIKDANVDEIRLEFNPDIFTIEGDGKTSEIITIGEEKKLYFL